MAYDDRAAIDARVKELLVERLQVATDARSIGDDATLADLGLDSTAILSLVVGLEDAFGIEIPDREISPENFSRVDDMSRYVAGRLERIDR